MKANELRVGDWYNQFGNYHQATGNTISELENAPEGQLWCKPILITEEWLKRFGFYETSRYGNYLEFNINQEQALRLPICKHSEKDFWYVLRDSVKIQYVHQLQNLYFVLTGEELTIKS